MPAPAAASPAARLFAAVCAAFSALHLYTAATGPFTPLTQRGVFIGVAVLLALWTAADQARSSGSRVGSIVLLALALGGLAGGLYAAWSEPRFMDVMNDMTRIDIAAAGILIVAVLVATRRQLGWSLPVLSVIGLLYYAFGNAVINGTWQPPRVSLDTLVSTMYGSTNGMFGFMADIGTSVIAIYVIYGSLLMATGAGEVFVQVAGRIAGRGHGGPAKVAVVTSALFGTVSGSAVANVMAVGTLTIPTMNRAGYPKALAAGVEASASAGGQIMPPIMGAGAFLMAELLNVPYLNIALAASLPAILYFTVIFISVDLYARRHRLGRDAAPRTPIAMDKAVPLAISVAALIGMLAHDYTPTMAAVTASAALLVTAGSIRVVRGLQAAAIGAQLRGFVRDIWNGLVDGGKGMIMIGVLLACAGILTTVLGASGLGAKVSSELVALAGSDLLLALILSAFICILLGMDVPTTASYVLTASVAAPVLTRLGLPPLTAHLFIFYFAILSAITPPVCASVYAASAIAKEGFWSVARYALIVAGAVYVIPFMFVYRPTLLLPAPLAESGYALLMTALAMFAACSATIGYLAGPAPAWVRALLLVDATLFFIPGVQTDATAAVLLVILVAIQTVRGRHAGSAAVDPNRKPSA
jgi:TRAP transporter 4TM/12TM fusion protein